MRITTTSIILILAMFLVGFGANPAYADGCDATVTAPGSIQAAIDGTPTGVVCLDDSAGPFLGRQ